MLASRGSAQGPSPPRAAWRPCESAEPACAGSAMPVPTAMDGVQGYALTCCGRLCKCVPSSMLAVRHHHVTTDDSRTHRPALLWSFHTTPQACRRRMPRGRLRFPLGGSALSASRGKTSEAVWRGCRVSPVSLRSSRPMRPWLVVNPGGGTAAPWASWPQPSGANNFPCAVTAFRPQAVRPAHPPPDGSQQGRDGRDLG